MSYWVEDGQGYLGDFATVGGAYQMLESPDTPPALKQFLETERADAGLVRRIIAATREHARLDYVAKMLRRAKKPPVRLCDGVNDPCDMCVLRAGQEAVGVLCRALNAPGQARAAKTKASRKRPRTKRST